MKRKWQRRAVCAGIAVGSVVVTLLLTRIPFFQNLDLKTQDAHFVLRGKVPTRNIVVIGIDEPTLKAFPELESFWHPYYADAIRGAAEAGAKVFVLDHFFEVPVEKYEPGHDALLAQAYADASPKMPVITAFIASSADQKTAAFAVPLNMLSSTFGTAAFANLTVDRDDFVRRQELIEAPSPGVAIADLKRSLALRAAEEFLGKDTSFRGGALYLGDRKIPTGDERDMNINYAGPAGTFPRVSLVDFVRAVRAGNQAQLERWVKGKVVLLGPDDRANDAHDTPFFTAFGLTDRWRTPGVEVHANTLNTILTGAFLKPVSEPVRILSLAATAGATVAVVVSFTGGQMGVWSLAVLGLSLIATQVAFRAGWLLSGMEMALAFAWSLIGGVLYRSLTAERKSSFFRKAVALFVGEKVAWSLEKDLRIGLTGKREMVTILFSDIRGFTAFCESKDPAEVVDVLNAYMATMCAIVVRHGGHVNKFIGDGILAVFSDEDAGAQPGDHARRAVLCAIEMVEVPGQFSTGTGLHSGEVVIGNVGSSDKMEFTVLGDTVNLASRLESLNKERQTKLLLSEATFEMIDGAVDTLYLGTVSVRGKSAPMKIYTAAALVRETPEAAQHTAVVAGKAS